MFDLLYNFVKISFYSGIGLGIFGLIYGIGLGFVETSEEIKSLKYHSIIQYNPFYVNYYNYFIKYISSITNSMLSFNRIFFIIGLLLPSMILIISILYFVNKFNQLLNLIYWM